MITHLPRVVVLAPRRKQRALGAMIIVGVRADDKREKTHDDSGSPTLVSFVGTGVFHSMRSEGSIMSFIPLSVIHRCKFRCSQKCVFTPSYLFWVVR